ncbi:MAG TPA: Stp1/IreP family PP2C-type Ser/Thr phosphatase [Syntrophorhabdales bacterium]|nr:Stp1/IreP family PP2C-type Ser/Thr phosphatase [Syntrophorhabdales bacterium]
MSGINCAGKSDIGLKRSNNEDSLVVEPGAGLLVVADGMGGAASGEVASQVFADTAREVFLASEAKSDEVASALVQKAFLLANDRILAMATENRGRKGMGCTAELLAFYDRKYILGHVGDSRTYMLRQGKLKQMTRDHSLIQEQIDEGLIPPAEARTHALRNVIVRAVGVKEALPVDLIKGISQPGDIFLLCSDGLTDMLVDDQIQELLSLSLSVDEKAEKLIETANSAGGYDNVTVALCEVI